MLMLNSFKQTIIIGLLLLIVAIPIMFVSGFVNIYQTVWLEAFVMLLLIQYQTFKSLKHGNSN